MSEDKKIEEKKSKVKDVTIVRDGEQIILPTKMSLDDGIAWLQKKKADEEKVVRVDEVIETFPLEGAYAFYKVLSEKFGFTTLADTPSFFGSNPPTLIALETGVDKTEQVPWGRINIPGVDGYVQPSATVRDGKLVFVIGGETKRKHMPLIQELGDLTRQFVKNRSIYRGKAIRVSFPETPEDFNIRDCPHFMDVSGVKPEELIFPTDTRNMVETSVLTPIKYTEACRAAGIPRKRGILMEGPYGVGKTLTANVTAKTCEDNGWTFIYLNNVRDLAHAIHFAKVYQPAVIFAEDIDRVMNDEGGRDDRSDAMDKILNTIDGIDTKSLEVMVVLTTNHVERINRALLRPGRLDAVISVKAPDAEAVQALVRLYARKLLSKGTDLQLVGQKLAGQIPAVIREVVERSKLAAISRSGGSTEKLMLVAEDLDVAATSMLTHLELLKEKPAEVTNALDQITDELAKRTAKNLFDNGFAKHIADRVAEA